MAQQTLDQRFANGPPSRGEGESHRRMTSNEHRFILWGIKEGWSAPVFDAGDIDAAHGEKPTGPFVHLSGDALAGFADAQCHRERPVAFPLDKRIDLLLQR